MSSVKQDYAGAIADFTVAVRLDPMHSPAWYHRGNCYYRRGQYHQALSDLGAALQLRPKFDQALASRGTCLLHFGEYEKALADYTKAAELQAANPRWLMICAALNKKLGRPDEARAQREQAIKLDPTLKDAPDMHWPPTLGPVRRDPELPKESAVAAPNP